MNDRVVQVSELKSGDCTPWYEVREDAESDPTQPDVYRVLVRHFDNGVTDYVRGGADETVPIVNAET
jgi:hypothetical protein